MKKLVLLNVLMTLVLGLGCQKKDSGGDPAAPACGPGAVYTSFWARCVSQTGCPVGLGQHPEHPSMCMRLDNGVEIMAMSCGAGFYLTSKGCLAQGMCPSGMAQAGDACTQVISGSSSWPQNNPMMMNGMGMSGFQNMQGFPNSQINMMPSQNGYYRGY